MSSLTLPCSHVYKWDADNILPELSSNFKCLEEEIATLDWDQVAIIVLIITYSFESNNAVNGEMKLADEIILNALKG